MLEFPKKYVGHLVYKCQNTRCFVYISFSKEKRMMCYLQNFHGFFL
ncbi:hypothetical protein AMTRI_Chr02g261310 [Amborella trichopoda]